MQKPNDVQTMLETLNHRESSIPTAEPGLSPHKDSFVEIALQELCEPPRIDGVVIGEISDCLDSGEIRVDFPENMFEQSLPARTTVAISKSDIGRKVALVFEGGDPLKPFVIGPLHQPCVDYQRIIDKIDLDGNHSNKMGHGEDRLIFSAEKEIVFKCGESSITLTRAGKILIRGKYILSRSSGVNRIKGGSVQIN